MADLSDWRLTTYSDFVEKAVIGPAYCEVPITRIASIAETLGQKLSARGVPTSAMTGLFNDSLLGICPVCGQYCAGGLMLSLALFAAIGTGNISFMTGTSGGGPKQRLLDGQCGTPACSNRDSYHLFWCPDLHPEMLDLLHVRYGIMIDPNMQQMRSHLWKPQ